MSVFKERMNDLRRNPSLMQYMVFNEMDKALNGLGTGAINYDIPDATLPFAFAMECGIIETTTVLDAMESISRSLFPELAITSEDLYKHMSDDDYIGRFASPAKTTFELLLGYDEVVAKAVSFDSEGNRKLTIPRLTEFKAAGIPFTMQYPIDIKVSRHNGVNITYNMDRVSPIETLSSNILDWNVSLISDRKILVIKIPVNQMQVSTYTDALSPSTLFQTSYTIKDKFFYARAYMNTGNGWNELYTTHSDLVYDPMRVTVVFKVVDNVLQVSIPAIYTNLRMAVGSIRVDIYSTLGTIERDLGAYKTTQFDWHLNDIDDVKTFVSPLRNFNVAQPIARDIVDGGADGIVFDKLRERVINNTLGPSNVPITNVQLEDAVDRKGYTLVSNVDNITNRQFLATRKLDTPKEINLASGAGVTMSELILDIESVSGSKHVHDNDTAVTILPSMLYSFVNGKVTMLSDARIDSLLAGAPEMRAREANSNRFVYSPFHTVLDVSDYGLDARPYYLDNPEIKEKLFVGENVTANMQATIDSYYVEKVPEGYKFLISIDASQSLKDLGPDSIIIQFGYKPQGENGWASGNAVFVDRLGELLLYEFVLETNYNVDRGGRLHTTNMSMFTDVQVRFATSLETDIEVTVIVADAVSPSYKANLLDTLVQSHLLPSRFMCVVRERLVTTLGYDLTKLWRRSRPVPGAENYVKWENDVYAYYKQDVYETHPDGSTKITIKPDGSLEYTILHHKGDPILSAGDVHVKEHIAGQAKTDVNGKPLLLKPRKLLHEVSMLMVDGLFYFGTEDSIVEYRKTVPMTFVKWIKNDIESLSSQLLEQAKIYLYPTNTFGDTLVAVREGYVTAISVEQSLNITLFMRPIDFSNPTIRPALTANIKQVLNEYLNRKVISISDIIAKLKDVMGESIMNIDINGLGGTDNNYTILTVRDDAARLTIRKRLVVLSNQELIVEDDLNFNFMVHQSN